MNTEVTKNERGLYIAHIDLGKAIYFDDEINLILRKLRKEKLYHPRLLYRGFDGERIDVVKQFGTDIPASNVIWCSDENYFCEKYGDDRSALRYAQNYVNPALSIYDGNKMTRGEDDQEYNFVEGISPLDALIAVFVLKYKPLV